MPDTGTARLLRAAQEKVAARTKTSADLFEQAQQWIPSGVTSALRYHDPCRIFVQAAKGGRLWDVDGNEYLDCRLGFGPMLLGHAPERILDAVQKALAAGSVYSLSHPGEVELARKVTEMVPGADMATFCSSGSEATLHALRLARGYTGRKKIAKFEGGYHGVHDTVMVGVQYRQATGGPPEAPVGAPDSPGIPEETVANTVNLPFNHPAALETIAARANELAAVIVEPLQGGAGCIPARPDFLRGLRDVTARHGVVLIFDEVMTGFRLALGGAQEYYGVRADLATFGKILGGGLPLAGLAGRREIMRFISIPDSTAAGRRPVSFGGTFNGNPVAVAAANATLDFLRAHPEFYADVNRKGDRIRREVQAAAVAKGLPLAALGDGSFFSFRFVEPPVTNVRDFAREDPDLPKILFLLLLAEGILTHPTHNFLCVGHTDRDIERIIRAHQTALEEIASARAKA